MGAEAGGPSITAETTSLPKKHKEIFLTPQLRGCTSCYLYLHIKTSSTKFSCKSQERLRVCACVFMRVCVPRERFLLKTLMV